MNNNNNNNNSINRPTSPYATNSGQMSLDESSFLSSISLKFFNSEFFFDLFDSLPYYNFFRFYSHFNL